MRRSAVVRRGERRLAILAFVPLAFGTAACRETSVAGPPVDPAASLLTGRWEQPTLALQPAGRLEFSLTFAPPNRFTQDVRSYGVYAGQTADELSGYWRIDGTYATHGAALDFMPRRVAWWDRFYGANSRERTVDPAMYADIFDNATFRVEADHLTIDFVSYPADAPMPAQMILTRVP